MAGANSGTVTPLVSANSLLQQLDNGPAASADGQSESGLSGTSQYANNAAAKTAGLVVGQLYVSSADPHAICIVV